MSATLLAEEHPGRTGVGQVGLAGDVRPALFGTQHTGVAVEAGGTETRRHRVPPNPARDVRPGVLHLLTDFSALPPAERNIIWRFFTDARARERYDPAGAWNFARESVADLRSAAARYPDDAGIRTLVDRLRAASEEFAALWAGHEVRVHRSGRKRLRHPVLGWLELDCEALHIPEGDQWVVLYTAAPGSPSYQALRRLRELTERTLTGPR